MTEQQNLTHVSEAGEVWMVDISGKKAGPREAVATGTVRCKPETINLIKNHSASKGDVLATIRLAGIQGAKRTPDLVPLAHPIAIQAVRVDLELDEDAIKICATVKTNDATGIEMEALTAVSCSALTAIDMIKGVDRGAFIENIRLEKKTGGKVGVWNRDQVLNA